MPQKLDTRIAFLFIHYPLTLGYRIPKTKRTVAAIVFGFFTMLRFHKYGKFQHNNLTIVLKGDKEIVQTLYSIQKIQCFSSLPIFWNFILHSTINITPEQGHTCANLRI